jgi:hypothetical protein
MGELERGGAEEAMTTLLFIAVTLLGALGWAAALLTKVGRDHVEAERKLAVYALSKLYAGQHVGGCNNRYDRAPCGDDTGSTDLCAPCFGRRALMGVRTVFPPQ